MPNSQQPASTLHIFGIRHHGPGSARSLRVALEELRPDVILVEGPPDAEPVLPLLTHAQMQPPVALLIYQPDMPQMAVYYPFALFSPEWQAMHYGLTSNLPVWFMDLPLAHQLANLSDHHPSAASDDTEPATSVSHGQVTDEEQTTDDDTSDPLRMSPDLRHDPLGFLAQAAGYSDGERWWEHMVEQRRNGRGLFAAILEAMTAVRAHMPPRDNLTEAQHEARREAFMRKTIRRAQQDGYERIAVVCGAWHAPALVDMPPAKEDAALLKGLPKVKVQATWVPWTYSRLAYQSGYGAGIESPGWYHHLFAAASAGHTPTDVTIRWMTRIAHLLRSEDLDASSAHVIEAVRLAETLAALRDRPLPGLPEMTEAARAVFCFNSDAPMHLIHEQLIVSEVLGTIPDETPMVPLQQDLQQTRKRLRLLPEATWRDLDLDLRKSTELERSHLLHRLNLLDIPWGTPQRSDVGKGTFHEIWRIQWQPELDVKVIEAGMWGNTIVTAATACACAQAEQATDLPTLTSLVNQALFAGLTDAIPTITHHLQNQAAVTSDVVQMMAALPSLARIVRYGDVRQTDAGAVGHVLDGLVIRICIGLPGVCASLNDDAASEMFQHLVAVHDVVTRLQNADYLIQWQAVLRRMADQNGLHGLLAGRCVRLLLDMRIFDPEHVARQMNLSLSTAGEPAHAAAWVDGLLRGRGELLVHDEDLWQVVDGWVTGLSGETFTQMLPLLRRTFATFHAPERRNLGERVCQQHAEQPARDMIDDGPFDPVRAQAVLPIISRLVGLEEK